MDGDSPRQSSVWRNEFVDWLHREKGSFLTNSSERTPREPRKLNRLGIDVEEKHFYTSAGNRLVLSLAEAAARPT